jgi:hypothetical protein
MSNNLGVHIPSEQIRVDGLSLAWCASGRNPVAGIFVNYRVGDEAFAAVLIDRELSDEFGAENVFRASRSIPPGDDFHRGLLDGLRRCSVLLAVIGQRWSDAVDAEGRRRIMRA